VLDEDQVTGSSLGVQIGDQYVIHDKTAEVLEKINKRLNDEEKTVRSYRRALAFSQMMQKDLIPILLNSGDNFSVFDSVVRLLVNLTVPVECLCPLEVLSNSAVGRQTLFELNKSLTNTKKIFRDRRYTRVIMEQMSAVSCGKGDCQEQQSAMVNNCLLLIRNILHIPDVAVQNSSDKSPEKMYSMQNQIMWNLFAHNLDRVLLELIQHKNGSVWCTSVVQLIALVYKDQHLSTLQELLQSFLESSLSESSEDNESNTSPKDYLVNSCDATTDDTSDQNSRETSSPDVVSRGPTGRSILRRRVSSGSLEVLPNNSPAPSSAPSSPTSPPQPHLPTIHEASQEAHHLASTPGDTRDIKEPQCGQSGTSGIESETGCEREHAQEPPTKVRVREGGVVERRGAEHGQEDFPLVHKATAGSSAQPGTAPATPPTFAKQPGSGSESSDITGIPKSCKKVVNAALVGSTSSDYGYLTGSMLEEMEGLEAENQEMVSSSSNEEDQMVSSGGKRAAPPRTNPVKPRAKNDSDTKLTEAEKKDRHRLKLLKRSKENRMRVKAMVNHIPSDTDISELLTEFTVDFLHNGYASLVSELLDKLSLKSSDISMDKSHFLWLLTYFMKFASQLEIGLDQIGSVISFRTLSYLTYEGVELLETVELAHREQRSDVHPHLRKMHLVVVALREFLQTVGSYTEFPALSPEDVDHIKLLKLHTFLAKDVRQLIVLLLRRFKPGIQSLQYLSDLVVTNHILLLDLEKTSASHQHQADEPLFEMPEHVMQFANVEMMRQYGRLLEGFEQNTPFVNDCIFTVMHHVAGDLDSPQTLYIPSILKSFSKIWEQGLHICDDWVDLIEYIIQKFIQTMGNSPHSCAANMVECLDYTDIVKDEFGLTEAQASQLFWHFSQVENSKDPVGAIIDIFKQDDNISLSRLSVIQALLSNGIITHAQYMNFIYMKNVIGSQCKTEHEGSVIAEVGSEHCNSDGHITDNEDGTEKEDCRASEIQVLKDCLVKQGRGSLITWLQDVLLVACRVKMFPELLVPEGSNTPHEPIPFYFNKARQSIPLVPWNRIQYQGLQSEAFILMLHKLGFHLPADVGKVFPRIPHFWSADHIYSVAMRIGPVAAERLKFNLDDLEKMSVKEGSASPEMVASDKDHEISDNNDIDDDFESMDLLGDDGGFPMDTGGSGVKGSSWMNMVMMSKKLEGSMENNRRPGLETKTTRARPPSSPGFAEEYMQMD